MKATTITYCNNESGNKLDAVIARSRKATWQSRLIYPYPYINIDVNKSNIKICYFVLFVIALFNALVAYRLVLWIHVKVYQNQAWATLGELLTVFCMALHWCILAIVGLVYLTFRLFNTDIGGFKVQNGNYKKAKTAVFCALMVGVATICGYTYRRGICAIDEGHVMLDPPTPPLGVVGLVLGMLGLLISLTCLCGVAVYSYYMYKGRAR
jgi:hypothetical protein